MTDLATQIVSDGEGASKLIFINLPGGSWETSLKKVLEQLKRVVGSIPKLLWSKLILGFSPNNPLISDYEYDLLILPGGVKALEKTKLRVFKRNEFLKILQEDQEVFITILSSLFNRLREANVKIFKSSFVNSISSCSLDYYFKTQSLAMIIIIQNLNIIHLSKRLQLNSILKKILYGMNILKMLLNIRNPFQRTMILEWEMIIII